MQRRCVGLLCAAFLVSAASASSVRQGWGDNGNGLYRQPKVMATLRTDGRASLDPPDCSASNAVGCVRNPMTAREANPTGMIEGESGVHFTKVSNPVTTATGYAYDAAAGDCDKDGDLDLLVAYKSGANKLFRNGGGGNFAEVSGTSISVTTVDSRSIAWCDVNKDSYLDVVVGNYGAANELHLSTSGTSFAASTGTSLSVGTANTRGIACGDFNNDGNIDLLVGNTGAANELHQGDGAGGFTLVTGTSFDGSSASARWVALGDYNNDGFLDAAVATSAGHGPSPPNELHRGDGQGGFTLVTGTSVSESIFSTNFIAFGDYDGDG